MAHSLLYKRETQNIYYLKETSFMSTSTALKYDYFEETSPELSINPATRDDMDVIAEMIKSSADWYRPFVDEKDMSEHDVDDDWKERNYQLRDFHIAHSGSEPVGTVSLQHFGDYVYLGYVYLFKHHVGKGFGKRLLEHAERISRSLGRKGMILIAHPEAKWAKKAYLKYGFEIISSNKKEILAWQNGVLTPHYEEGFELYRYDLSSS